MKQYRRVTVQGGNVADFFSDKEPEVKPEVVEEEPKAPEKIKLGNDEYTQEDLSSLVGLGKIAREAEEKYNTKIDRVWPDYTKKSQELKELKERFENEERTKIDTKINQGETLTEDERVKQALTEAERIGLVTKQGITKYVSEVFEARDLLDDCKDLEEEINGKDGRPAFKSQEILQHMQETGIRNPEKAYKDKYEPQIDQWKEEQLKKAKPQGIYTESASVAGRKEPENVKVTKDNLDKVLHDMFYAGKEE